MIKLIASDADDIAYIAENGAHIVYQGKNLMISEMNREYVDKGNGLRALCEHLGIQKEETVGFGDNDNDIGMLEAAGVSYAVETARESVKKIADYICPSYSEKGVYQIIKKLI